MATIKTAISIEEKLYKKVIALSSRFKIPKSRIFSQAVEFFIEKNDNLELLKKINSAYMDEIKDIDAGYMKSIKTKYSEIIEKW